MLTAGTWYQATLTFGPSGMKLYLNGELLDSDPYTGGTGTTYQVRIGEGIATSGWYSWPFHGVIDELAFFSRELSAEEVMFLQDAQGEL